MDKLYFFVTSCDTWQNVDTNQYLANYFITEGGFLHAFLIALIIAVVFAGLFYGWIGMKEDRLSNLGVWLGALLFDGVIGFIMTKMLVIGSQNDQTGVFNSIVNYKSQLLIQPGFSGNDQQVKLLTDTTNNLVQALADNCNVVMSLCIGNAIISVILFFIISICVKNLTVLATHVPF